MDESKLKQQAEELIEKVKALVKKGNIAKIVLVRNDETVLNIPLNVGVVGTILGLASAPWAMLLAALVSFKMDCRLELITTDGRTVDVNGATLGEAAGRFGDTLINRFRKPGAPEDDIYVDPIVPDDAPDGTEDEAQ